VSMDNRKKSDRPLPEITPLTRPFWEAARRNTLVMQKCGVCGFYNYPPKPYCDRCASEDLSYQPVSGRGKVYSYTVVREARIPSFEERVPYVVAAVEMDEQPGQLVIANLPDSGTALPRIGQAVEVVFERINDEISLPQFRVME
jgi:uncharacterized protein